MPLFKKKEGFCMEKTFDMAVIETKQLIIKTLNESNLPITVISMIIKEIDNIMNNEVKISLERQISEINKKMEEEKDGDK
jgi:hypothetical protein